MAKSSADDEELRRACESAIEGKENIVLSIRVAKSRGIWGKSSKVRRHMAKPRVLALTCMFHASSFRSLSGQMFVCCFQLEALRWTCEFAFD